MRLKLYIIFYIAFLLVGSCKKGEFTPSTTGIELTFPINGAPCEKGINIPNSNTFEIELEWKVTGMFDSFELFINGEKEDNFNPKPNDDKSFYTFKKQFGYNTTNYEWQVIGINGNFEEKSPINSFSTPATPANNNTAPYPVTFTSGIIQDMTLTVTWETIDVDPIDNVSLRYDVYYFTENTVSSINNLGASINLEVETVSFEIPEPNFSVNQRYYVLVVAKDSNGNASYSRDYFCQLCD